MTCITIATLVPSPAVPFPRCCLSTASYDHSLCLTRRGRHATPPSLFSLCRSPSPDPTVTKINKKEKSARIFQQSLSPGGFSPRSSLRSCARPRDYLGWLSGPLEVRMSIYRSGAQWQNCGGGKRSLAKVTLIESVRAVFCRECEP